MNPFARITPALLLALSACSDVEKDAHDHHDHEHELITTLVLTFSSQDDDAELEFTWTDPNQISSGPIDEVLLEDGTVYDLSVRFLNELEDPPEDITLEIGDEDDEHQLFFTGSAVDGPSTATNPDAIIEHAYADQDANGHPIGLNNTITTLTVGSGDLVVTLRHLPRESGNPVKTAGMAEDVASGGLGSIGGDTDVQVTFSLEVQ